MVHQAFEDTLTCAMNWKKFFTVVILSQEEEGLEEM